MKPRLGMTPQELVETFNEMYLRSWGEVSEKISWERARVSAEGDLAPFLMEVMEAVVNAARDSTVMTIYENNERVAQDLKSYGYELSSSTFTKI